MKKYSISQISDINIILNFVHDRSFEIDNVYFDVTRNLLSLPLSVIDPEGSQSLKFIFLKKMSHRICSASINIYNVFSYELIDDSKIGYGNINNILLENKFLVITCGLPVTIKAKITSLLIELIITDTIVGHKNYWRI